MSNSVTYSDKMETALNTPQLLCREIRSRKARMNVANGQIFSAGQEIRIPISLQNGVIAQNSAMFYATLVKTGISDAAVVDFSTFSLFDSVRVEAGAGGGATILELCDDIGLFYNFLTMNTNSLSDLQYNQLTNRGATGFNRATTTVAIPAIAAVPSAAFDVDADVTNLYTMSKAGTVIPARVAAGSSSINFSLNLSDAMGLFTQNLVLSGTTGICLVLRVAPAASQLVQGATTGTITIEKPYLMATILEGGDKYEKALKDMKSGPNGEVSVMFNTYSRYIQNANTGGTNIQLLVTDTAKSVLGYVAISRDTADITNVIKYKNSSSGWGAYENHALSIGGVLYPQNPISSAIENYEETRDLYKVISRKHNHGSILTRDQGLVGELGEARQYNGNVAGTAAVIAVNLTKCDDKNVWGIGANTTGAQSVFLQVSYTPTNPQTVHIFAIRQQKVHIDGMGNFSVEK